MTLEHQVSEARKALQDLQTDETALSTLHAQHAAKIEELRAADSRDFATLATLEAKRTALGNLLEEQRTSISQARLDLQTLEARQEREDLLNQVGQVARCIRDRRAELDAALQSLFAVGGHHIRTIIDAQHDWDALRGQWRTLAAKLGTDARKPDSLDQLLPELVSRGVPVDMLRLVRFQVRPSDTERIDPWPMPHFTEAKHDLDTQVKILLQIAAIQAIEADGRIQAGQLMAQERAGQTNWGNRLGSREDHLLSHLPADQRRAGYVDPFQHKGGK